MLTDLQYSILGWRGKRPSQPNTSAPNTNFKSLMIYNFQLLLLLCVLIGCMAQFTMRQWHAHSHSHTHAHIHTQSNTKTYAFANNITITQISDTKTYAFANNITITPIQKFGAFINGIDICNIDHMNHLNIQYVLNAVYKHKFVIFKKQCMAGYDGKIPAHIYSSFAIKFGTLQPSLKRYLLDNGNISIFSNNASIGDTCALTYQWHIDQVHIPHPFAFQHMISIPQYGGGTDLLDAYSMLQLIKRKNASFYRQMHRLFVSYGRNDLIFPLIEIHPVTQQEYINIATPICIWRVFEVMDANFDFMRKTEIKYGEFKRKYSNDIRFRFFSENDIKIIADKLLRFVNDELVRDGNNEMIYSVKWESGDLLLRDNLQILHRTNITAYDDMNKIGLRELWRITLLNEQYSN